MKIKFWILVVIIYKVTGNVSCKFKSYRGSHICRTKILSYHIKPENFRFRALSYYILWFLVKSAVFDFNC